MVREITNQDMLVKKVNKNHLSRYKKPSRYIQLAVVRLIHTRRTKRRKESTEIECQSSP